MRSVDGSTVSPTEPHPVEPPLAPANPEFNLVPSDEPGIRVLALVAAVSLVGAVGGLMAYAWQLFAAGAAGRVSKEMVVSICLFLSAVVLLPGIRRLWRIARRGVRAAPGSIETTESRAFVEAVERYDRQLEAQRLAADEIRDEPRE